MQEDIDDLIASLDQRGVREKRLHEALLENLPRFASAMATRPQQVGSGLRFASLPYGLFTLCVCICWS